MPHRGPNIAEAFASAVERRRKAAKMSRQALAEAASLHQTYVGLLERGLRNPSLTSAKAIADALGVSLTSLIAEAEDSSLKEISKR